MSSAAALLAGRQRRYVGVCHRRQAGSSTAEALSQTAATEPSTAPPFENMVWVPGGTFLMGSDAALSGGGARASRHRGRLLDGPLHRDQRPVSRSSSRPRATSRSPSACRTPQITRAPNRSCWCPRRSSSASRRRPVDLRNHYNWWDYVPGAQLAPPAGAGQLDKGPRPPPGGARRLRRRRGLCAVGRQGAADRGRMGVCRARRPGGRRVRLGR